MADPTYFVDDSEIATRSAEVPDADWDNGCNAAASCAPGIGINYEGGPVVGTPEQFTLLDQFGGARTPQVSAQIGFEDGDTIRAGTNGPGDGSITPIANVALPTLAGGWVAGA